MTWQPPPPVEFDDLDQARRVGRWLRHLALGFLDVPDPHHASSGKIDVTVRPPAEPAPTQQQQENE